WNPTIPRIPYLFFIEKTFTQNILRHLDFIKQKRQSHLHVLIALFLLVTRISFIKKVTSEKSIASLTSGKKVT
ncbi:hypothetical protein, partial [Pueribacillus sp. YX66]|uniref:hypothetical protein n=1 Tax=Pueribacillus sp. YX66 TaxID=3229242 RepID=UPI00358D103D